MEKETRKLRKKLMIIYIIGLWVGWLTCLIIGDYLISGFIIFSAMLVIGLIYYHTNKKGGKI